MSDRVALAWVVAFVGGLLAMLAAVQIGPYGPFLMVVSPLLAIAARPRVLVLAGALAGEAVAIAGMLAAASIRCTAPSAISTCARGDPAGAFALVTLLAALALVLTVFGVRKDSTATSRSGHLGP